MVEYHEWVGIVFDDAKSKGYDASFDGNQEVTALAAEVWNEKKVQLSGYNTREAKALAKQEVSVR